MAARQAPGTTGTPDGKGGTRLLELPGDVGLLESYVRECEAALVILDRS